MPARIEAYALIGDCETTALVSKGVSIDWLCFPRFDSPACFAALLGTDDNGHWSIRPDSDNYEVERRYREDALVLETQFKTETGISNICDFMPLRDGRSDLIPRAERMLGNFPQAFSHVGLVNSALNLARAAAPAEQRSE